MSDKNKKSESSLKIWIIAGLIFAAVLLIFGGFTWVILENFGSGEADLGSWAEAGATYGVLAALFTGLAFAGLIVTILLQRKDLSLQREELKLQRNELRRSGEALENQSETLKAQLFESSFFRLFDYIDKTRRELKYISGNKTYKGEEAIGFFTKNFKLRLWDKKPFFKGGSSEHNFIDRFEDWDEEFLNADIKILIESLLILLEMADSKNKFEIDYKEVISLLTSNEMKQILLLHCMYSKFPTEKRNMIICSGLLENIKFDELSYQFEDYAESVMSNKPIPWLID